MKTKFNLSGLTVAAAALCVGFAGNVQAIPITLHDFRASQAVRAPDRGKQNQTLVSLTTSISPRSSKAKPAQAHQKPGARNLILPISGGLTLSSSQGAFPARGLHAPLLPASPVNLPPPSITIVSSSGGATQNAAIVPDGGATAALMAGSLGSLVLLKKKLKA